MRTRIADYELRRPLDDELSDGQTPSGPSPTPAGDSGIYLAQAPARLGFGDTPVVVHISPASDPTPLVWVRHLSAARSPHLPALIEAGGDPEGTPGSLYWVHTWTGDATMAKPPFPLSLPFVLWLVAGASRGAHALHEVGLVHGHINPRVIHFNDRTATLDPPATVPGVPPGVVRRLDRPADLDLVEPGVAGGEFPSRASEIWTLGALLHLQLSGQLLHPGLTEDPPVTAVQRVMFEPPRIAPGLDPEATRIISACLAGDPARRPQTADELADQLENLGKQR
jgi:eukaryotic-like serine/threonine-protein kinase